MDSPRTFHHVIVRDIEGKEIVTEGMVEMGVYFRTDINPLSVRKLFTFRMRSYPIPGGWVVDGLRRKKIQV